MHGETDLAWCHWVTGHHDRMVLVQLVPSTGRRGGGETAYASAKIDVPSKSSRREPEDEGDRTGTLHPERLESRTCSAENCSGLA